MCGTNRGYQDHTHSNCSSMLDSVPQTFDGRPHSTWAKQMECNINKPEFWTGIQRIIKKNIPLCHKAVKDEIVWQYSPSDEFSVSLVYWLVWEDKEKIKQQSEATTSSRLERKNLEGCMVHKCSTSNETYLLKVPYKNPCQQKHRFYTKRV